MKRIWIALLLSLVISAQAGDLWQWAPDHWTYTDDKGHVSEGWRWAPGHTTWTDDRGHVTEIWEWAPNRFSIEEQ